MDEFKDRLNKALKNQNMSAAELSRRSGIDEGTLSNYKNGKYTPKTKKLKLIADSLNASAEWLMGADVPMERETSKILDLFNMLNKSGKQKAVEYLEDLSSIKKYIEKESD